MRRGSYLLGSCEVAPTAVLKILAEEEVNESVGEFEPHQITDPCRRKKWDRHPLVRHTDGVSVARPSGSSWRFQLGESWSIRLR